MIDRQYIDQLVQEKVNNTHIFPVSITVSKSNNIIIILDSDESISIDDCIAVSRQVESNLDREKDDFELNVSSAGLTQPLTQVRQYKKNIDHQLDITLQDQQKISGYLKAVDEEGIEILETIRIKKQLKTRDIVRLRYADINTAKLIITF